MRLIIKPAGLVILVVSFVVLALLAVQGTRKGPDAGERVKAAGVGKSDPPAPATAGTATAATPAPTPLPKVDWSKARQILEPDIASNNWKMLVSPGTAKADHQVVPCTVKGHPFARKVTIVAIGANPWEIQIAHPLNAAFKKGMRLRLTYWARSSSSNEIAAVTEQASEPFTKLAYRKAQLTPEWKQYSEEWEQTENTASGWAHVNFQVGTKVGDAEFTGVILEAVSPGAP